MSKAKQQITPEIASETEKKDTNLRFFEQPKVIIMSIITIVLLTFVVYFPALDNDFVNWDDDRYITGNPFITDFSWETIKLFFSEIYFQMYIPLTMISYSIEYSLVELDPSLYHFTNIFIHLANTVLVYLFVFRLSDLAKIPYKGLMAIGVALLFGLHTVHVESVTWISERKDVLYSFFYLLSLSFYVHYLYKQQKKWLWIALLVFLLGLFSKALAVTLSVSLLAVDYIAGRNLLDKRIWLEKIPFLLLSLVFGMIAIYAVGTDEPFKDPTLAETQEIVRPFYENFLYASYGFTSYIAKLFYPYHLSSIYPYPIKVNNEIPLQFWFFPFVVFVAVGLFFYFFKRNKIISFSIFFFTLNLILVLQLFSYQSFIITDRYSYLASIGFSFLLIRAIIWFTKKKEKLKPIVVALFSVYVAVLGVKTYIRNDVWQNSETLWNDVIDKYPEVIISYFNRGNYYQEQSRLDEAIKSYSEAINLKANHIGALSNRGISKAKKGDAKGALDDFNKVVEADPNYANIYSNRGNANIMLRHYKQAIADYNKAIERRPDFVDGYFNRANAHLNIGNYAEAIADYEQLQKLGQTTPAIFLSKAKALSYSGKKEKALTILNNILKKQPENWNALYERSNIYRSSENKVQADADLVKATQINPQLAELILKQAATLETQNPKQAEKQYLLAQTANPKYTDAYINLGVFYGKQGKLGQAIGQFTKCIEKQPNTIPAYSNRAYAYDLSGNRTKAIADYSKVIEMQPQNASARLFRATIYQKNNQMNQVLEDLNYLIEHNIEASQAYYKRAEAYRIMNKKTQACADYNKALELGMKQAESAINLYCK